MRKITLLIIICILLISCNKNEKIKDNSVVENSKIDNTEIVNNNLNKIMYVNATSGLRVRSLPSTEGEVLVVLKNGTVVNVIREDVDIVTIDNTKGKWIYINNPIEGWVFDGFLTDENPIGKDSNGIVWIVEPTLEYENVIYCHICGYTANSYKYKIDELTGEIKGGHDGHGGPYSWVWLYDSENGIFGLYTFNWDEKVEIYPINEFSRYFPKDTDTLNYVKQVDSKVITGDADGYDLGTKYKDSNFAVAYGSTLLTDFIYDKQVSKYLYNQFKNAIPVSKNGKLGFINKKAEIIVPLIFDDIATFDGTTAFVKTNGKYGIIKVPF